MEKLGKIAEIEPEKAKKLVAKVVADYKKQVKAIRNIKL